MNRRSGICAALLFCAATFGAAPVFAAPAPDAGSPAAVATEATRALVRSAAEQPAASRRELVERITSLGEGAVPALILEWRTSPSPVVRRFAGAQLEAMEKRMPGEAIQTKSQEVLAEVLRAYGVAKEVDALGVVLSFTNADRDSAREASRQAIYDYGAVATGKLREAYGAFHNRPAPEDWPADRIARELFAAYDRDRRKEMYVLLDEAVLVTKRAQEKTPPDPTLLATAVDAYDRILARAPTMERRAEMVPAYVLLAQAVEPKEPERAAQLYRKAAHLDPTSPRMPQIEGALLALEAKALRERGVVDEEMLKRAIALDPANATARAELGNIERAHGDRAQRWVDVIWIGAAVATIGVVMLFVLAVIRRARRAS